MLPLQSNSMKCKTGQLLIILLAAIAAAEADDGIGTFKLQPGFRIELVAAEPLLRDPIAMSFDEHGRLFVVEYPEYNQQFATRQEKPRGRVRMLEDTDGDGRFDHSRIYVSNLDSPSAVACYDGGVFVAAAPDLLFCKDTDGDGRADQRQVVFTGFVRMANRTDPSLNSIRWGLDNRFYACTSYSGSHVRRVSVENVETRSIRNRGFLFDPRTRQFDLSSGGGQHGLAIDDWGRQFLCNNSSPVRMLMYDDRYLSRNPMLKAPPPAVEISAGGKFTKLFRISPDEPWRVERTRMRNEGAFRGSNEGGAPSGFFTSATGVTVYRGDAWPARYRGNVFVGEPANNLVFRAQLESRGIGFIARRADRNAEFLASTSNLFRPVQFANAPDGHLYVIDMHRELIEGGMFLPPNVLQSVDAVGGDDRGRIYRIVHEGQPTSEVARGMPGQATTAQLVSMLEHRNGWHRDTASRLLYQRRDASAVQPLVMLAMKSPFPVARMTALYALDGLGGLDEPTVQRALDDPVAQVRVHAIRLAESRLDSSPALRSKLIELADDDDLLVRYQVAFSLGEIPLENQATDLPGAPADLAMQRRNAALARIVSRDGQDQWIRLAVLSSLHVGAGDLFQRLAADTQFRRTDHGRQFLLSLSRLVGNSRRPAETLLVVNSLARWPDDEKSLSEDVVVDLLARTNAEARRQIVATSGGRIQQVLERLLRDARVTALDPTAEAEQRTAAIRKLSVSQFDAIKADLAALLEPRQADAVQSTAIETLMRFDHAEVAELLLSRWPKLTPKLRVRAAETLLSRPNWSEALLDAIERGEVGRRELDAARVELLKQHPNRTLAERVTQLFGDSALTRRQEIVQQYHSVLELSGDSARGKQVFKRSCSACHRLDGVGTAVGADLMAIRDRGKAAVLLNILDPNRDVKPQYVGYSVLTDDGRVIAGMIAGESVNSITIRRSDGTEATVLRTNIELLHSSGLSFMPEGLEKQIDKNQMADLIAYLMSQRTLATQP